jgi:hypothetical protein
VEVGIIAGNRFQAGRLFDEPHDGIVMLSETALAEKTESITVPYCHTFIMYHQDVADYVGRFLRTGRFT